MSHVSVHGSSCGWTPGAVRLTAIGWAQALVVKVMVVSLTAERGPVTVNARVGFPSYEDISYFFLGACLVALCSQCCGWRCPGIGLCLGVPCTVMGCLRDNLIDIFRRCVLEPCVFCVGTSVAAKLTANGWAQTMVVRMTGVNLAVGRGPVATHSMVGSISHGGTVLVLLSAW